MLANFTTGLALVAASAHAWGSYPSQWGGYNNYNNYNGWSQPAQEPAHDPWSSTPSHHTPWAPAPAPQKPEGWYSPTQQYTNPLIQYVSVAKQPVYTVCELEGGDALELAQLPGHPIYVRGSITGLSADTQYLMSINEKGRLGASCDAADTGDEFNPLFETDKYGNPNPFQDPSRGRLTLPVSDASGDITLDGSTTVMQNLAGEDSLIGRSLTLKSADGTPIGCCVIARDMAPEVEAPPAPEPTHHHHQQYYPSYYYGHYQPNYYNGW